MWHLDLVLEALYVCIYIYMGSEASVFIYSHRARGKRTKHFKPCRSPTVPMRTVPSLAVTGTYHKLERLRRASFELR